MLKNQEKKQLVSLPKFLEQHLLIQNQIATTHAQLLIRQLANGKL